MLTRDMHLLPNIPITLRFNDSAIRETLSELCARLGFGELPEKFSPQNPARNDERRSKPRPPIDLPVTLTPVRIDVDSLTPVSEPVSATTQNISRAGIGLRYSAELPSSSVIVTFDGQEELPPLVVQICWQYRDEARWKGGGLFAAVVATRTCEARMPSAVASCL